MFAFHNIQKVCEARGQMLGFRFRSETAPAGADGWAVIPMRQAGLADWRQHPTRLATSCSYSRLLEQWPDIGAAVAAKLTGKFTLQVG
ncbi:hypothetical protein CP49_01490 [Bradyrhizobium valentinum]|uniref:Uncharacterized protein n=1 Tax=Bradyrhizobium valentinum TaxID=1518501 RepID=A0A0R3LG75_9BRAD|nr:hypothetical protein CP49_01490 [Bradyrhizobium valentinum]